MQPPRSPVLALLSIASLVAAIALWPTPPRPRATPPVGSERADVARGAGGRAFAAPRTPPTFVPNRGQWDERVRFAARSGAMTAWFTDTGWTLAIEERAARRRTDDGDEDRRRGAAVRMELAGATSAGATGGEAPRGEENADGRVSFFRGSDPARWVADVPRFARIRYPQIQAGIDLVVRDERGRLEYDLMLAAGVAPEQVAIRCEGQQHLRIDAGGALELVTALGPIVQPPPVAWQVTRDGERRPVACRYRLLDERTFGFAIDGRDASLALVIDPGLLWSGFLGGTGADYVFGYSNVQTGPNGEVFVAGDTQSTDFPATTGAYDTTTNGLTDAYACRIAADGSAILWATYFGGQQHDRVHAMRVDPATGVVTVVGNTASSTSFPTTAGAYSTTHAGGTRDGDAFVVRLDPNATGSAQLVYSTLLGGTAEDVAMDVALETATRVAVHGRTTSTDFPTTPNAISTMSFGGPSDAWVARLDLVGSGPNDLVYSTYFGGGGDEYPFAVAVNQSGEIVIGGRTGSGNIQTTANAFQTSPHGSMEGYIAAIDPTLPTNQQLRWCTYFGASNWENLFDLAITRNGNVVVAGDSDSSPFLTTPGAFQRNLVGANDAYVARLDPSAQGTAQLVWCTYLGHYSADAIDGIALDAGDNVVCAGITDSPQFPTTPGAYDTTFNGGSPLASDGFVAVLKADGSRLLYSTFLGGSAYADECWCVSTVSEGGAVVAGTTMSTNFPSTPGSFATTYRGGPADAFVSRLDLLPRGAARYGRSTPACGGGIPIGVNQMPSSGAAQFAVTCTNAPPGSGGLLILGRAPDVNGLPIGGINLHIGGTLFIIIAAASDAVGTNEMNLPLGGVPPAVRVYLQYIWLNTATCGGFGTLSASNALDLTVQ